MVRSVLLLLLTATAGGSRAFAAGDCAALKNLQFPDTTVTSAEAVPKGALELPGMPQQREAPALCRVRGVLHPSADSVIRFEVWLPEQGWNGRLLNVGNGGFAGSIGTQQMFGNLRRGYATAGSDAGHQAEAEDASWAYRHPEKIADFGYRAVHLTAQVSKAVVKAYYAKPETKAYFDACSDGGREALMEAQRFPDDYDGILAGAPANNWTHLLTGSVALLQETTRDPAAYISSMKLPAITSAALNACDAADGVKDGVVSDPLHCGFDPAVLLCKAGDDLTCLTAPQVASLRALYRGGKDAGGQLIFPGLTPGDESPSWHDWVLGNAPGGASGANYMTGYFRYMVMNDPTWNPLTADVRKSLEAAVSRTGKDVDATDPDLSRFAAHGGRLVLYHGWSDAAISPWNTVHYYDAVRKTMGAGRAEQAVRLYMVPGMEHCAGGPGPNTFGQLSLPAAAGEGTGAMDLLQAWVEQGKAPGALLAAKESGTHEKPERTVRPLCPYPQQAKYNGKGDPKLPESFGCAQP